MAAAGLHTQSPEMTFLLCCARVDVDGKTAQQMQGLLRSGLSWPLLLKQARTQKIMPLVYQSVQTVCPNALPQDIRQTLQRSFLANSFHNRFLTRELLKLLALFAAHHIPAFPYKGSALVVSIYGDLRLRMFGDLDIVVHPQDVMAAQNVLLSQGYRLLHSPQHTAAQRRFHFHLNFKRKDGKVPVELHWAFTPRHWFLPISFEQLQEEAERFRNHKFSQTLPGYTPQTLLARRSVLETVGRFNPILPLLADTDWFLRAAEQDIVMELLPDALVYRRMHQTNITRNAETSQESLVRVVKASLDRRRQEGPSPRPYAFPQSSWRKEKQ